MGDQEINQNGKVKNKNDKSKLKNIGTRKKKKQ